MKENSRVIDRLKKKKIQIIKCINYRRREKVHYLRKRLTINDDHHI